MYILAYFSDIFNEVFWVSLACILITAIISVVIKITKQDRCIAKFKGLRVLASLKTDFTFWGDLKIYSSGIELLYDEIYDNGNGIKKKSYICYEHELQDIEMMTVFLDGLTEKQRRKRRNNIRRIIKWEKTIKFKRWIMNVFYLLQDAFKKIIGMFIKMASSKIKRVKIPPNRQQEVGKFSKTVIEEFTYSYDPVLEHYICKPVVVEIEKENENVEFRGILAEYTKEYLCILNVSHPTMKKQLISFDDLKIHEDRNDLKLQVKDERLLITNLLEVPLVVKRFILKNGKNIEINLVLPKNKVLSLTMLENIDMLETSRVGSVDLIVLRENASVRHGGPALENKKEILRKIR